MTFEQEGRGELSGYEYLDWLPTSHLNIYLSSIHPPSSTWGKSVPGKCWGPDAGASRACVVGLVESEGQEWKGMKWMGGHSWWRLIRTLEATGGYWTLFFLRERWEDWESWEWFLFLQSTIDQRNEKTLLRVQQNHSHWCVKEEL